MNTARDTRITCKQRFSYHHGMHDREDAVFSVIGSFHLRWVGKERADARALAAGKRRLVGAHHGVQPAFDEHVKEGFVGWNRRDSSRYRGRKLDPFLASRALRAAGEPADLFGFHAEVFLKHSPDPNRGGHMIFGKADVFSRQL